MTVAVASAGPARVVTLRRSERKNALSKQAAEDLAAAIEEAGADPAVRGVIIAAEGDVFMAGGDLDEFAGIVDDPTGPDRVIAMGERLRVVERAPVPVVAAVSGNVYGGGCEFVLLCDLAIAEEHVHLCFRHAKMGLAPAWGGASRLLERVGPGLATRWLLSAEVIEAPRAAEVGLVTEVAPRGASLARAVAWIEAVAKNDRGVVAANKAALLAARERSRAGHAEIEAATFKALWGGPAHRKALEPRGARRR